MRFPRTLLSVLGLASVALMNAGTVEQARGQCQADELHKLTASGAAAGDSFGYCTAIDGDRAVISGNTHEAGTSPGSAYVFRFDGSTWVEESPLVPLDGATVYYGHSIAISGDWVLVGSHGDGAVYFFRFDGSTWVQEAKVLNPPGGQPQSFGVSVAVSGNTAVIGDHGADAAFVYRFDGSSWNLEAELLPWDTGAHIYFGYGISLFGDVAVIGAYNRDGAVNASGSAYVFRHNGSDWVEEAILLPSDGASDDRFGVLVRCSGNAVLIGARDDDDNGENSGSAYVYRHDGASWVEEAKLLPSDGATWDRFGNTGGFDGDIAVIGSCLDDDNGDASGSAYVFRYDGSGWIEEAKLLASDGAVGDNFGGAWGGLGLSGDTAIIGAWKDDDNGTDSGSAYVFTGLSDCNANGTLDICEVGIPGDMNGDGLVNGDDIALFVQKLLNP